MPNWKSTVIVQDLHQAHQAGTMSIQEVARQLAERLKKNKFSDEPELEEVIDNFEDMAKDPDTTADDYDMILSELYSFADDDHRIWVKAI